MKTAEVLEMVSRLGGQLVVADSTLRLVLPKKKATPELIAALKAHKEELLLQLQNTPPQEPPSPVEETTSHPKLRATAAAAIPESVPPGMVSMYHRGQERVLAMLERIFPRAAEMGWTPEELFMLRQRVDLSGLVGLLAPDDQILAVTPESIEIRNVRGVHQKFYRRDYPQPWLSSG